MKIFKILIFSIFTAMAVVNVGTVKAQVEVGADVTFSVFHDNLSPYGRWVNHPTYGQVWVSSEQGFTPYRSNGHWAYTEDGWTWVSDYKWGWAPFHYGRWDYDVAYGGNFWVPGYEWGPAWVSWRRDNSNYGWAPLRPGITIGVGASFGSDIAAARWTFVPNRYIASPYVNRYYVPASRNTVIIRNTTIINNAHSNSSRIVVVGGPQRTEVERYTHTKVTTYAVANSSRPGTKVEKNTINIYRPVVNKTTVVNNNVVNKNHTVVNNNQKTTVNKNSNNTTVNKNSNNKVDVNKKTTVNNNKKVDVNKKTTVNNNQKKTNVNDKTTVNNNQKKAADDNKTVAKKPVQHPDTKKAQPAAKKPVVKKPAAKPKPEAKPKPNDNNKKPE